MKTEENLRLVWRKKGRLAMQPVPLASCWQNLMTACGINDAVAAAPMENSSPRLVVQVALPGCCPRLRCDRKTLLQPRNRLKPTDMQIDSYLRRLDNHQAARVVTCKPMENSSPQLVVQEALPGCRPRFALRSANGTAATQ